MYIRKSIFLDTSQSISYDIYMTLELAESFFLKI
jgi:hypothetical protein